ncbi:MAG: 4Fe-4S binding protein [Deltaproteobacteria bacterium]|nr:4Fe-4S binding protein [Deltaproteobacteria bacterium]MBW1816199.1 4Fe-4S binding protein [Deltaproteobacteria bacterium]MBW2286154.1 4Fe-4S binding protein [Deltaproteobacteria bacterium]
MEQLKVIEALCVGCGQCTLVCEFGALKAGWGCTGVDEELCVRCGVCLDFCPVEALVMEAS